MTIPRSLSAGLDLAAGGRDFSALVVCERVEVETDDVVYSRVTGEHRLRTAPHYLVRHVKRWPNGYDPFDVVHETADLMATDTLAGCRLLYDATGLGQGVRGLFRELYLRGRFGDCRAPVGRSFTGAAESTPGTIAKVDMVSQMARLAREGRVLVAKGVPHADQLRRELLGYQVKVLPSGRESFGAVTEGTHDDLVVALGLAVWRPNKAALAKTVDHARLAGLLGA